MRSPSLVLAPALVFVLGACQADRIADPSAPPPAGAAPLGSLAFSPDSARAYPGDTIRLQLAALDSAGRPMALPADLTVGYEGDTVVTKVADGVFVATRVGQGRIVAHSGSVRGAARLVVDRLGVGRVEIAALADSVLRGTRVPVAAQVFGTDGRALTDRPISWTTSDAGLARVEGAELVALAAGTVTLVATAEGVSAQRGVRIARPTAVQVAVTPGSVRDYVGRTVTLSASARDAAGATIPDAPVQWVSSAPGVATVAPNGVLQAIAPGTATITATVDGRSSSAAVTIAMVQVASVTISAPRTTIETGSTVALSATPRDSTGAALTGRAVSWSSSNAGAAAVDASGVVRGVAAGSATITATSEGRSATVAITVTAPPPPPTAPEPGSGAVVLVNENFDRFTGVRSGSPAVAAIYPIGGNPTLVTGRGDAGRAVRFPYTTSNIANSLEAYFTQATDVYVRYWFRTSPGADPTAGGRNPSGIKWFMAWRSDDGMQPRYTMGVGNLTGGPVGSTNSGLEFSSHDQGSRQQPNPFMQNVRKDLKYGTVNDGQWHKYTVRIRTGTGGFEQIWIDGHLVLDSRSYGYDHPSMGIRIISFPGNVVPDVPAGWEFTIDVDDLAVWTTP